MNNPPQYGKYVTLGTEQILSFFIVVILVLAIGIYYFVTIRKLKDNEMPKGLAFLVFIYINWIRNTTIDMLGIRYEKFVWYFIYIFTILVTSNLVSIAGIESLGSSFTVPLTLGLIAFFGTFYFGIKYRKWSYINEFVTWINFQNIRLLPIPNPLKMVGKVSQTFSLMFRYWGNMFASSILLGAVYELIVNNFVNQNLGYLGATIAGAGIFPLHMYFDLVPGTIQPLIFMMLTMSYWSAEGLLSKEDKEYISQKKSHRKYLTTYSLAMPEFI